MKISRYRYSFFVCLLLSLVVFNACKSKQKLIYSSSPVEDKAYYELFSDIISSEFPYHTFTAKLNMRLTSGTQSFSSKANIRIVKNQALQISIQPLFGVEMFRFYMNSDSLFLLDRMNKRYVLESISSLKEHYPVGFDYYTMQSLFTNAIFISGKEKIAIDDYPLFHYDRTSDQNYRIAAKDPVSEIDYSFTVNGDDRITFTHLIQPEKKYYMQWEYHHFSLLDENIFPYKMKMSLSSTNRKIEADLSYSDIVIDSPISLELKVPSNYTKTSIDQVLKILSPGK